MKKILNVRIDQELKDLIDENAVADGLTSSEYVRDILEEYFGVGRYAVDLEKNPMEIAYIYDTTNLEKELPLATLFLLINYVTNDFSSEKNLKIAKGFLENLTVNKTLNNELRFEFLKVLNDINRILMEGVSNTSLHYVQPNNMYSLNTDLVFNEVYKLINNNYRDE